MDNDASSDDDAAEKHLTEWSLTVIITVCYQGGQVTTQ